MPTTNERRPQSGGNMAALSSPQSCAHTNPGTGSCRVHRTQAIVLQGALGSNYSHFLFMFQDFFGGPRSLHSQQPPLCYQEGHGYPTYNDGTSSQPHHTIACPRISQSTTLFYQLHSSYISRSDSCFPTSSGYGAAAMPCTPTNIETKPLCHYPESSDRYPTESFPSAPAVPMHCSSSNLPVQDQDLMFPPVSCPKHPYDSVASDATVLNRALPPSTHVDVYPLYTESSPHIEAPHVFPIPKTNTRIAPTKPRRPSMETTVRSRSSVSQQQISVPNPDSSSNMQSCGPNGLNKTVIVSLNVKHLIKI
ncbi:unnamed protein product [Ranitomeya imitator]|uniref:Uncharacterized protein n=1 Tax=Ranitomeya imitator TaxID=111125 RepID=A0ABN9L1I0_9NEOB|nr:unnamed protein product [Ranitomeya imitator]